VGHRARRRGRSVKSMVDLRSDTVTRPSAGMLDAMMSAEVGDDVFREDPTVLRLQERLAELFGKQSGLYVPSGTMANQICLALHAGPGDEVILEATAHPFLWEGGAPAAVSGISVMPVRGERGLLRAKDVEEAIRPMSFGEHVPRTKAIGVENTANTAGGTVYPTSILDGLRELSSRTGIALHLDGARIWNAHVASGVPLKDLAAGFDTVSVCLSKGLGCPIGSVVLTDEARIEEARRLRKRFGGAMRQVGYLAAAGLYAIEHNIERMAEDHRRARRLAEGLAEIPGLEPEAGTAESNMVFFGTELSAVTLAEHMAAEGVHMIPFNEHRIRAVTHLDVDDEDVERALRAVASATAAAAAET